MARLDGNIIRWQPRSPNYMRSSSAITQVFVSGVMKIDYSSPRKPGDNTGLISAQRERPAIAFTQPLNYSQTQTISLR